jgi:hypothetical protein
MKKEGETEGTLKTSWGALRRGMRDRDELINAHYSLINERPGHL